MAAIVDVALLSFSNRGIPAKFAGQQTSKKKIMLLTASVDSAVQDLLDAIKKGFWDERLVRSEEGFAGSPEPDQADVEGVVEQDGQSGARNLAAVSIPKAQAVDFLTKIIKVVPAGSVKLESFLHQRCLGRVRLFGFSLAHVQITQGGRQRVKTLLDAAVKAFASFLAQAADVI